MRVHRGAFLLRKEQKMKQEIIFDELETAAEAFGDDDMGPGEIPEEDRLEVD